MNDPDSPRSQQQGDRLAEAVSLLAAELTAAPDQDITADHVCHAAVKLLAPCTAASVTIREGRHNFQTLSSSDQTSLDLDSLQYRLSEGPCFDVASARVDGVWSDDLREESRWPEWTRHALDAGVHGVVAVPLLAGNHRLGAFNLYSHDPGAWTEDDYHLAQLFTAHATVPLSYAHEADGLSTAISNRHTIGIAQGILMRDYDLDVAAAFKVLQTLSAERNVKVQQLAQQIVAEAEQSRGR
ncbi:GAF and ANTAR domain-containing protein [Nocardioides nanhaiensis]|uniref:GAF and ANTAR domain-containing protein n=1 Tax=Nocardioides nanhaiensis TaxID=1476871 RepID=A0ABP8WZC5_9ACTN